MADQRNEHEADNLGLVTSDEIRTGFITGVTFGARPVEFYVVDGRAIFEGDIDLGLVDEVTRTTEEIQGVARETAEVSRAVARGIAITGQKRRWPNAVMPYTIDPSLKSPERVTDAIDHYHQNTRLRLVRRTSANASRYPNYVNFKPHKDQCSSRVGMTGGKQDINLADGCPWGTVAHEIGHAWGLWHEQSRSDRDMFIRINWQNIQSRKASNFNQHISDGDDIGPYDYGSIMHYGRFAFSKNGETITPLQRNVTIGQRDGLSTGDIEALHWMYVLSYANQVVNRVFATTEERNGWVHLGSLGWRRLAPESADGVTNMLALAADARVRGRGITVRADGRYVYRIFS